MRNVLKHAAMGLAGLAMFAGAAFAQTINGGGATFPNPLYQKWILEYKNTDSAVTINYASQGSGFGIKGITDKTLHFAGSDAPLSKDEIAKLGGDTAVVQFPTCAGGVVPAYNLPGVSGEVKFTGEILADIYLGKINNWSDPKLAEINPGMNLPNLPITVAYRSDGSGTTNIFTNYLSVTSEEFAKEIGPGKQVKFPVGQGGKGSEGVTQILQTTPGAIGYIEHNYAEMNKVTFGLVKNKAGEFVKASPDSIAKAAGAAAGKLTGQVLKANLWNQDGAGVYPIAAFTYQIVYVDLNNLGSKAEAESLVKFLKWETTEGQKLAASLSYAPLAPAVQEKVASAIGLLNYKGEKIGQ
ncbi:MAG: phosphate ABC transporter substrate-binding protein PstS [Tepidisphaeraceae bacterium]